MQGGNHSEETFISLKSESLGREGFEANLAPKEQTGWGDLTARSVSRVIASGRRGHARPQMPRGIPCAAQGPRGHLSGRGEQPTRPTHRPRSLGSRSATATLLLHWAATVNRSTQNLKYTWRDRFLLPAQRSSCRENRRLWKNPSSKKSI